MTSPMRVVSLIASLLVIAACAATTPGAKPQAAAVAQNPTCLKQTGSRLPAGDAGCKGTGYSYSSDDINRTGETTAGDALRQLDPSVTISH